MPTMPDDIRTRRLRGLRPMVGDTPLLTVRLRYRGCGCGIAAVSAACTPRPNT